VAPIPDLLAASLSPPLLLEPDFLVQLLALSYDGLLHGLVMHRPDRLCDRNSFDAALVAGVLAVLFDSICQGSSKQLIAPRLRGHHTPS